MDGCNFQFGGSDQWGNMTTGLKMMPNGIDAHCITFPLVTKENGEKFGKSESGTIWLTKDKTSVYNFYQFWYNQTDKDVIKYLKMFTFFDELTINKLIEKSKTMKPNWLQIVLAETITSMVHGNKEMLNIRHTSDILFDKKADKSTFYELFPSHIKDILMDRFIDVEKDVLDMFIVDLLVNVGIAPSKRDAREKLAGGAISENKEKVLENNKIDETINNMVFIQYGKKNFITLNIK